MLAARFILLATTDISGLFDILSTKSTTDGCKGFRFNYLGTKGIFRKRKIKSRGWFKREQGKCMTADHFGKRTVYFEHKRNRIGTRKRWDFAGSTITLTT